MLAVPWVPSRGGPREGVDLMSSQAIEMLRWFLSCWPQSLGEGHVSRYRNGSDGSVTSRRSPVLCLPIGESCLSWVIDHTLSIPWLLMHCSVELIQQDLLLLMARLLKASSLHLAQNLRFEMVLTASGMPCLPCSPPAAASRHPLGSGSALFNLSK